MVQIDVFLVDRYVQEFILTLPFTIEECYRLQTEHELNDYVLNHLIETGEIKDRNRWEVDGIDIRDMD